MTSVVLRLEGPMQAWSAQGKLGLRDTEREPTKSGVLGLVGSALGMERDDDATLAALSALTMAVRVDRPGSLLHDYQTAGGGRFRGEKYTVYGTKDCVPSDRYYLQGASFVVALEGDEALIARIAEALRSPRWPLFLGRRSCPPSVPPLVGVVAVGAVDAVRTAARAEGVSDGERLRIVYETRGGDGDARFDVPLSFAAIERRYGKRYVRTEWTSAATLEATVAS